MSAVIRIELLLKLTESCLKYGDKAKAVELLNQADSVLQQYQWPTDYRIKLVSQLCVSRFNAGDIVKADKDREAMLELFKSDGDKIVDIYRAQTLYTLAEAYYAAGKKSDALNVYKIALRHSLDNPNSRPRAEDLTAACCSMALNSVEPDEQIWNEMKRIRGALAQPW